MTLEHITLLSPEGGVILLLLFFSLVTWSIGLLKLAQYARQRRRNQQFRQLFWQQENIDAALRDVAHPGALANLARATQLTLERVKDRITPTAHLQDRVERALQQQIQRERRSLENGLALLASIGTTSPFIGLFGTVWGIMAALQTIGQSGSASLDTVAGPIGNALIATGIGIAVAVPAVLIYNYFLRQLKLEVADMDDFAHDIYSVAQAQEFHLATEQPAAPYAVQTIREVV
ncbi:MotA/TolQ/ExbB proton channel family protein [Dickeya solani]|uniref:ExbB proton channel n=1 Tax=Dickeya solani D s0432-1 TaxID=1231725 RepID=A0AAV3KD05_9GAMM|nr:MotA/TolQ/ExbB proton channel family protein [Dickeya solani]ANE76869.1 biopolymer transporter ExbB [Dickeya solani IPO 2222]AUC44580.1 MotA/TolQ/ExbB proton channel family protein [Dickeya solani RNS 08.23.3.1.A]AUH07720.1 biopolymer transporter ExbB [Dickeya solani D s0432-1]AUH11743.1 biopolymer transporter ExbB [Dickeya solani]AYQ47409.1 Biopolymer transport protein ExbB [Dickeya solani]